MSVDVGWLLDLGRQLVQPLWLPFEPTEGLFVGHLVVGLPLAYLAWRAHHGGSAEAHQVSAFVRFLVPSVWLRHASVLHDVAMLVLNTLLMGLLASLWMGAFGDPAQWVAFGLQQLAPPSLEGSLTSSWPLRVAVTVSAFLAADLAFFSIHYLAHRVPLFWEFHKVHHSAEVLNPATEYRAHPVQLMATFITTSCMMGAVYGVFAFLTGNALSEVTFLGLNVLFYAFYAAGGVFRHSHVWIHFGVLSYLVQSPAMHQIHHSADPRHWGKNLSGGLAVWDWLFGTLYVPAQHESFETGLGDPDASAPLTQSVWSLYLHPFYRLWTAYLVPWWRPLSTQPRSSS